MLRSAHSAGLSEASALFAAWEERLQADLEASSNAALCSGAPPVI